MAPEALRSAAWQQMLAPDATHARAVRIGAVVVAVAIAIAAWITSVSFLNPTDARVYLAAGERLLAGHELYALSPGDRHVLLNPPYWTVPFLSPPAMGIVSIPFALLGDAGIAAAWATAFGAYLIALALLVRGLPIWGMLAVAVLAPQVGAQLAIGNVNALLALGLIAAWVARDRPWVVGAIVASMVAVKVTPAVLVLWLLASGRRRGVAATALWLLVLVVGSILLVGQGAHFEYLGVATQTVGQGTTELSIAGLLRGFGVSTDAARLAPWIVIVSGALVAMNWRRHEGFVFGVAVVLMTVGSPSFNPYWLALTMFALVPLAVGRFPEVS